MMEPSKHGTNASSTAVVAMTNQYKNQSFELLKYTFSMISIKAIHAIQKQYEYNFAACHRVLLRIDTISKLHSSDQTQRNRLVAEEFPFLQPASNSVVLKNKARNRYQPNIVDDTLKVELNGE